MRPPSCSLFEFIELFLSFIKGQYNSAFSHILLSPSPYNIDSFTNLYKKRWTSWRF